VDLDGITHLVITSCTGFYAPGLDVDLIRLLGLSRDLCRTTVGFMGCYAGITGLRTASDIVRADPEARVLIINIELCTLHLQQNAPLDRLVASSLFSDGCAASLVSARPVGFRLDSFTSHLSLEDADKMQWLVEDQGFAMRLDAAIPDRIRDYVSRNMDVFEPVVRDPRSLWAIHPGGRAILDAVRSAFGLSAEQIAPARRVLAGCGNMSSASVMFVFDELLRHTPSNGSRPGAAIAFGPGLTIKTLQFTYVPSAIPATINSPDCGGAMLPAAI
jgi:predicted naringenin-chalcone synthase